MGRLMQYAENDRLSFASTLMPLGIPMGHFALIGTSSGQRHLNIGDCKVASSGSGLMALSRFPLNLLLANACVQTNFISEVSLAMVAISDQDPVRAMRILSLTASFSLIEHHTLASRSLNDYNSQCTLW
jgi:hypothetical protein